MTDGPLKNLKLGNCWKRLFKAVQNDAATPAECGKFASDALARHLVTNENSKALRMLNTHLERGQLEFDPLGSIEVIFNGCEKTPFLDAFQRELLYRATSEMTLADAITPALDSTIKTQVREAQNRLEEECLCARDNGEITPAAYKQTQEKINMSFCSVEIEAVRAALLTDKKDAFEKDLGICDDVDAGMVSL